MSIDPLLEKLRDRPREAARRGGWTLDADEAAVESIGIRAKNLRLRTDTPSSRDPSSLGRSLAGRANYLLEPLTIVESDDQRALLRSRDREVEERGSEYYELWLEPDQLSLARYQGGRGQRRTQKSLDLTWEQAERFVRDVQEIYRNDEPEEQD